MFGTDYKSNPAWGVPTAKKQLKIIRSKQAAVGLSVTTPRGATK